MTALLLALVLTGAGDWSTLTAPVEPEVVTLLHHPGSESHDFNARIERVLAGALYVRPGEPTHDVDTTDADTWSAEREILRAALNILETAAEGRTDSWTGNATKLRVAILLIEDVLESEDCGP